MRVVWVLDMFEPLPNKRGTDAQNGHKVHFPSLPSTSGASLCQFYSRGAAGEGIVERGGGSVGRRIGGTGQDSGPSLCKLCVGNQTSARISSATLGMAGTFREAQESASYLHNGYLVAGVLED